MLLGLSKPLEGLGLGLSTHYSHGRATSLSLNEALMGFVLYVPVYLNTHPKSQGEFQLVPEGTGTQVTDNLSSSVKPSVC